MTRVDWRRIVAAAEHCCEVSVYTPTRLHWAPAKFHVATRREIARAYLDGSERLRDIARRYGVRPETVRKYAQEAA